MYKQIYRDGIADLNMNYLWQPCVRDFVIQVV